jgi:hypothetical protein
MILAKPYAERRVLVIAPEKNLVTEVAKGMFLGGFLMGHLVSKLVTSQLSGVLHVSHHEAASELVFPPGHPLLEHAYGGHPLVPRRYAPLTTFHQFLFEEKVNELMTLLASLGATRVKVTCSRGYRTAAGFSIGVAKGAEVSGGVKGTSERSQEASFEEHFRPRGEPKLPANLVWYNNEASWQAVVQRRLEYGTSRFKTLLSYEDSFGIDANLKVGLDKLGVKFGGNYSNFESTKWEFEGEFA